MYLLKMFGISLALTLAIELPAAFLWGLRGRQLAVVALANVMTNPLAVALSWVGLPQIPIEIAVVLAEGFTYRSFFEKRPVLLAVASNALSWGIGLMMQL